MRRDHSGEGWQLAKHNIVGKLPTIAGWQPALPSQNCFGETPKPTRETRALPGIAAIDLLDFAGQQPAKIGQAVEIAENFDVEILIVVY
jgi:hypothetical protein